MKIAILITFHIVHWIFTGNFAPLPFLSASCFACDWLTKCGPSWKPFLRERVLCVTTQWELGIFGRPLFSSLLSFPSFPCSTLKAWKFPNYTNFQSKLFHVQEHKIFRSTKPLSQHYNFSSFHSIPIAGYFFSPFPHHFFTLESILFEIFHSKRTFFSTKGWWKILSDKLLFLSLHHLLFHLHPQQFTVCWSG